MSRDFIRQNRVEFTDGQKLAIWERSGHRCQGCGRPMQAWEPKQFDHVKSLAMGGETTVENGQVLCENCWPEKNADDAREIISADMRAKHHVLGRKKSKFRRWG